LSCNRTTASIVGGGSRSARAKTPRSPRTHLDGNAYGITKVALKGGDAGKPKVLVKGRGATLPLPVPLSMFEFFDQDTEIIVQLHSSTPDSCWSSSFDLLSTKKNTATQFKAIDQ
jgi:hypothetical protein